MMDRRSDGRDGLKLGFYEFDHSHEIGVVMLYLQG